MTPGNKPSSQRMTLRNRSPPTPGQVNMLHLKLASLDASITSEHPPVSQRQYGVLVSHGYCKLVGFNYSHRDHGEDERDEAHAKLGAAIGYIRPSTSATVTKSEVSRCCREHRSSDRQHATHRRGRDLRSKLRIVLGGSQGILLSGLNRGVGQTNEGTVVILIPLTALVKIPAPTLQCGKHIQGGKLHHPFVSAFERSRTRSTTRCRLPCAISKPRLVTCFS